MFETMDKNTKVRIKNFSIFASLIIVLTGILCVLCLIANPNWNNGLRIQVQKTLEKSRPLDYPAKYHVGKAVQIENSSSVSSALFEVNDSKEKFSGYAFITRMTTYYGPQAAVFLYSKNGDISFEGFANLESRVASQIKNSDSDIIIKYWIKKAKTIIEKSIEGGAFNEK